MTRAIHRNACRAKYGAQFGDVWRKHAVESAAARKAEREAARRRAIADAKAAAKKQAKANVLKSVRHAVTTWAENRAALPAVK